MNPWRSTRDSEGLHSSREREGAKLADVLRDRAARMRERIAAAEPLLPAALAAYRWP